MRFPINLENGARIISTALFPPQWDEVPESLVFTIPSVPFSKGSSSYLREKNLISYEFESSSPSCTCLVYPICLDLLLDSLVCINVTVGSIV